MTMVYIYYYVSQQTLSQIYGMGFIPFSKKPGHTFRPVVGWPWKQNHQEPGRFSKRGPLWSMRAIQIDENRFFAQGETPINMMMSIQTSS